MSDQGSYTSARLGDELRDGEVDAHVEAVLTDSKTVGDVLMAAERSGLSEGDPLYDLLARTAQTDTLRTARQNSDITTMNATVGLSESRLEATGYDLLIKAVKPAAQQVLIKGPKGSGKTTKALDIARHLHSELEGDLKVATNIRRSESEPIRHPDVEYIDTVSGMLEWVRETKGEKLVIGDEWSSTVNAHAQTGGEVRQTFSQFINALRKGRGGSTRLIVIGHEHDTDIAAIVRNQSDVVVRADGKVDEGLIDKATVFKGWEDYKNGDRWFQVRGLFDVEESSPWAVDTNYFATFELDLDNPQRQIQKGKLIENWKEYQKQNQDVREPVKCRGTKDNGDRCGAMTDHKSGYCQWHRDEQWNGDVDPRYQDEIEG